MYARDRTKGDQMKNINCALIGDPVKHSLTPIIIKELAEYFNIQINYDLVAADNSISEDALIKTLMEYDAVNVTYPLKYRIADIITTELTSVNLAIKEPLDNEYGFNHDGLAFWDSVRHLEFESILLVGSGITAQRIIDAANLDEMVVGVLARHPDKLKEYCDLNLYQNPSDIDINYDVIVNCTSVVDELPFGNEILKVMDGVNTCIDLNYSKETEFIKSYKQYYQKIHGNQAGAKVMDGIPMVIENALRTFRILTRNKYSMCTMRSAYNDLNLQRYAK